MLLLCKQLIRFVNGDIRSFFFARADCRTKGGYANISRPDIGSVKDLKGKRLAINTFGSSADFAIYQLLSRNGLDPNQDVTLLSIAGSPDARFAALIAGSIDATLVNSPFEYHAEQKAFKVLLSIKETAEFVKIPINGLSTSQRKIDIEPDESCACCGRCARRVVFAKSARDQCRVTGKLLGFQSHGTRIGRRRMDFGGNLPSQRKNHRQAATGCRITFAERVRR